MTTEDHLLMAPSSTSPSSDKGELLEHDYQFTAPVAPVASQSPDLSPLQHL